MLRALFMRGARAFIAVLLTLMIAGNAQADRIGEAWAAIDAEDWDRAESLAQAELAEAPDDTARFAAQEVLATVSYYVDDLPTALRSVQALDRLAQQIYGPDAAERLSALPLLAELSSEAGDQDAAVGALTRAVRIGRMVQVPPETVQGQLLHLAQIYLQTGTPRAAALLAAQVEGQVPDGSDLGLEAALTRARALLALGYPVDAVLRAQGIWDHVDRMQGDPILSQALAAYLAVIEAAAPDPAQIDRWIALARARADPEAERQAELDHQLQVLEQAMQAGQVAQAQAALTRMTGLMTLDDPLAPALFQFALSLHLDQEAPQDALPWAMRLTGFPPGYLAVSQPEALPMFLDLADRLGVQGAVDQALHLARAALAMAAVGQDAGALPVLRAQYLVAELHLTRGDATHALAVTEAALAATDAPPAPLMVLAAEAEALKGRRTAARARLERLLATLGTDDPARFAALQALGRIHMAEGERPQARDLFAQAAEAARDRFGAEDRRVAVAEVALAAVLFDLGQEAEALALFDPAMRRLGGAGRGATALALMALQMRGGDLPEMDAPGDGDGVLAARLAEVHWRAGEPEKAQALVATVLQRPHRNPLAEARAGWVAARLALDAGAAEEALGWLRQVTEGGAASSVADPVLALAHLPLQADLALRLAQDRTGQAQDDLMEEAFAAAQWANALKARAAFEQAAGRWQRDGPLAAMLRQQQDAEARVQALQTKLAAGDSTVLPDLQTARAEVAALRAEVRAEHPGFATATDPAPVSLTQLARLLGPDEAVLVYLTSDETHAGAPASQVFAVTAETVQTAALPPASTIRDMARDLRCAAALTDLACTPFGTGLAQRGVFSLEAEPGSGAFDLALAHAAYRAVIAPVQTALQGKSKLIIVPDQATLEMPFTLLVARPPAPGGGLRDAGWMIRDRSIRIVPTVASFARLRETARPRPAGGAFLGVGDPLIGAQADGPLPYACDDEPLAMAASRTRALGSSVAGLQALPDSRCELQQSAHAWQGDSTLLLQDQATQTRLAELDAAGGLRRYAAITFATHGLIAGEIGPHEAGLVLTPDGGDGLLTTAEVAALDLDADVVILSACNTAAGTGDSAEGLSGLASAFFYAGARSVMVSRWPVYSEASVRLSAGTLQRLAGPMAGDPAGALRGAILDILDDPASGERQLHPAYWASFFIAGGT